jgi:hypothetical protein
MKIYVASSWRNDYQPNVVQGLRVAGHEVYDFKNPKEGNCGFHWKDVALDRNDQGLCLPEDLQRALQHPVAIDGFASDFNAMKWADACVLVLPCGRSAHLEIGWMAGANKLTYVLAPQGSPIEPELMYGLLGGIYVGLSEIVAKLHPKHYPTGMGEESRRLHREYNALVKAQGDGARNGADVVRLTDECAAKGIILVPGGECL